MVASGRCRWPFPSLRSHAGPAPSCLTAHEPHRMCDEANGSARLGQGRAVVACSRPCLCLCSWRRSPDRQNEPPSSGMSLNRSQRGNCSTEYNTPLRYLSRLQTIPSPDIELPRRARPRVRRRATVPARSPAPPGAPRHSGSCDGTPRTGSTA